MFLPIVTFAVVVGALAYFGFRDRAKYRKQIDEEIEHEYGVARAGHHTSEEKEIAHSH